MKIKSLILVGTVCAIGLFILFLFPSNHEAIHIPKGFGEFRNLPILLRVYAEESATKTRPLGESPYPTSLSFIWPEYLSKEDYQKITKDLQIRYFRPNKFDESLQQPIIVAYGREAIFYGFSDGRADYQKLK